MGDHTSLAKPESEKSELEKKKNEPGITPEKNASAISQLLFLWFNPLFRLSKQRRKANAEIEAKDIWDLLDKDMTLNILKRFDAATRKANSSKTLPSGERALARSLFGVFGADVLYAAFFRFMSTCLMFLTPLLLNAILVFIEDPSSREPWEGYVYSVLLAVAMFSRGVVNNAYMLRNVRCSYQVRSALTSVVYRKALHLSPASRQGTTVGEMLNLAQIDSVKIEEFTMSAHHLWDGLVQVIGFLAIIYSLVGWTTFVGAAVMVIFVPVNIRVVRWLISLSSRVVKVTDARVKTTNECLQGISGVKLAAWEEFFVTKLDKTRLKEISLLRTTVILRAINSAITNTVPTVGAIATISVYAVIGGDIRASTLFTVLATFRQLRMPLNLYPQALGSYARAKVSIGRISRFLALGEVKHLADQGVSPANVEEGTLPRGAIELHDCEFYWDNPDVPKVSLEKGTRKKFSCNCFGSCCKGGEKKGKVEKTDTAKPEESVSGDSAEASVSTPILTGLNVKFETGTLTAVVGRVGVGRSALVNSIIGEMHQTKGTLRRSGSISYAAQSPWILNDTLRNNILFGSPMVKERYDKVIQVCQLTHDLTMLIHGDETMIGEKGINLSGGQKARVSVARAVYAQSDIVILDSPLAALDPHLANQMFEECILGYLKDRTRILVTNQLRILKSCDSIVHIFKNSSTISLGEKKTPSDEIDTDSYQSTIEQGTFQELMDAGLNFAKLQQEFEEGQQAMGGESARMSNASSVVSASNSVRDAKSVEVQPSVEASSPKKAQKKDKLMQAEERHRGAVTLSQYTHYIKAGGGWVYFTFVIACFVAAQGAQIFAASWLSLWTDAASKNYTELPLGFPVINSSNAEEIEDRGVSFFLVGYVITALLIALTTFGRTLSTAVLGLRASVKMHKSLASRILGAPTYWFDITPIGRIVSRFSKDLYLLDNAVALSLNFFLATMFVVVGTLATIVGATPWFAVVLPLVFGIYWYILDIFRPLTRDLKRLESISRSPVYANFGETLAGISTIRAYNQHDRFEIKNASFVDTNIKMLYVMRGADRWLGIRLESIGVIIAFGSAIFAIVGGLNGTVSAGLAGLSLSFSTAVSVQLNWTVRSFAMLESGMNSCERIVHYSINVPREAKRDSGDEFTPEDLRQEEQAIAKMENPPAVKKSQVELTVPPPSWPEHGAVEFVNVKMRYRVNTPLVLKGVSFKVEPGERVGIAGPSGQGKSSLLVCLLRLVEPEQQPGAPPPLLIDGVDICRVGLKTLRRRICVVQQQPLLFSGRLRDGLDVQGAKTDAEVWESLERVGIKKMVEQLPDKLESQVAEFGENFSHGERQAICLARALLESARILCLDESTAHLDHQTDQLIQNALRASGSFANATQLIIAHRIYTIMDCNKILVMGDGKVVEYDSPENLLADKTSKFSSMLVEYKRNRDKK